MTVIEVAYATADLQKIIECEIAQGTSPREAVHQSNINQFFPEINLDQCELGVFGKAIADNYELANGDRIEIYRPLIADPKEVRRQRAAQGLKTKKGRARADT
ncbi:MAG: RnfH family protein [Gammaproteobacteria bacterium]|nr:RnfH family protein [Gammaproteobacteria bacterium]